MLRQSLETEEESFLVSEGKHAHLGGFPALRNTSSQSTDLQFNLELKSEELPPAAFFQESSKARPKVTRRKGKREETFKIEFKRSIFEHKNPSPAIFEFGARLAYEVPQRVKSQWVHVTTEGVKVFDADASTLSDKHFLQSKKSNKPPEEMGFFDVSSVAISPVRSFFRTMRHLSANRQEFQRTIVAGAPPARDVGAHGEYTLSHLQRLLALGGETATFLQHHINEIADVRDLKFKDELQGYLAQCHATNQSTASVCTIADFGFGVSQCLPIVVQGALMRKNEILLVEQPEAQLHPTAQFAVGSLFSSLWRERGVGSIVETHSSNIVYRIRRDVARGILDPTCVSIAYFTSDSRKVVVKNLEIDKKGNLEKGLPMEFFGADLIESFHISEGT